MIAIIQGSNRRNNASNAVAIAVSEYLLKQGAATTTIDLVDMPSDMLHADMYEGDRAHEFIKRSEQTLLAADRWIFIFPEYNGSFPGALKLFIDALSVINYKELFDQHVAALIGTASGRAGNLRGIDHFTGVLHHMGTFVMPQGLPISGIESLIDKEGNYANKAALTTLHKYLDRLLSLQIVGTTEAA